MRNSMLITREEKSQLTNEYSSPSLNTPSVFVFVYPADSVLEIPNTGIKEDETEHSKSLRPSGVFDERFIAMFEKVESLLLSEDIKYDALDIIRNLIEDIDDKKLKWHEPFIEYDNSEYITMEWDNKNKSLYLNIDNDEQWWSKILIEDNKTKTDYIDIDHNNLSIHWEWVFNDEK